jgi:hypothetical protein
MPTETLRIERGVCHALFVYDAARSINLDEAGKRIHETSQRQTIPHKRAAPSYFEYHPPPLRVSYHSEPRRIGVFLSKPSVDLILYDFGAVSVGYTVDVENAAFDDLLPVAEELRDNALLLADSRKRVSDLLQVIGDAAQYASLADIVEDYVIFHIESFGRPFEAERFCRERRQTIAQILRSERRVLSDGEVEDSLAARMSYSAEDVVIADWNAALLIDREGDDVREVLQFANVELLEMRYLDQRLDGALDRAYETLSRRPGGVLAQLGGSGAELESIARLQVDNATLFEGVNNALKLLGDPYLARAYRLVNRRFHLDDWDTAILRKLETLESIYQKMSDRATTRRMEALEWAIIVLFVFSIVIELLRFRHG